MFTLLAHKATVVSPNKSASFMQLAKSLHDYAQSNSMKEDESYWLSEVGNATVTHDKFDENHNLEGRARIIEMSLEPAETRALLREVPKAYHTEINDALLTALLRAYTHWSGERSLLIELEGHGREEIFEGVDLSRTLGWFTSAFPVVLAETSENLTPGETLKSVKEHLRKIPNRGMNYGLLRYSTDEPEVEKKLRSLPQPAIGFNYLGQFDQTAMGSRLFKLSTLQSGASRSGRARRSHQLDLIGSVIGGRLQLSFTYNTNLFSKAAVERLAASFVAELRSLIVHCQGQHVEGHTPSDFPLARIDQRQLDQWSAAGYEIDDLYPLSPMQQGMLFHSLSSTD